MLPMSLPSAVRAALFQVSTGERSGEYLSHRAVSLLSILKATKLPAEDLTW